MHPNENIPSLETAYWMADEISKRLQEYTLSELGKYGIDKFIADQIVSYFRKDMYLAISPLCAGNGDSLRWVKFFYDCMDNDLLTLLYMCIVSAFCVRKLSNNRNPLTLKSSNDLIEYMTESFSGDFQITQSTSVSKEQWVERMISSRTDEFFWKDANQSFRRYFYFAVHNYSHMLKTRTFLGI
ncbi:hypothetical protein ABNQ38_33730 [Azospirillum sp. A29]|uniref:hypothetical protein n=1 Tax=Azospirillum sp. A29 TaxID=3160606 RepID=UPI00366BC005